MRTADELATERARLQARVRNERLSKTVRDDLYARIEALHWVLYSVDGEKVDD